MQNPIKFHGKGGEYFGIWIVNILLTILTLGIYSAWAHVRTKQYFYGNTELAGDRFEYIATPKQILMGHLIAIGCFALYYICAQIAPVLAIVLILVFMLLTPWIAQRSLRFNAQMSRYRGVRFNFTGSVSDAYNYYLLRPFLGYIALIVVMFVIMTILDLIGMGMGGLDNPNGGAVQMLPFIMMLVLVLPMAYLSAWIAKGIASYIHNGYCYGNKQFNAQFDNNVFFKITIKSYLITFGIMMLPLVLGSSVFIALATGLADSTGDLTTNMVVGLVVLYIALIIAALIGAAYLTSKMRNYTYDNTFIGEDKQYRFGSTMQTMPYITLLLTNFLMVIFSLGLLSPFARIRHTKFMADATQVHGDLTTLSTQEQALQKTSAIGDGLASGIDVNISF